MPKAASTEALRQWSLELQRVVRHAAHPWNEGVLVDSLVASASRALRGAAGGEQEHEQSKDGAGHWP